MAAARDTTGLSTSDGQRGEVAVVSSAFWIVLLWFVLGHSVVGDTFTQVYLAEVSNTCHLTGDVTMAAKKNSVQKILDLVGEFVTKQNGTWVHAEWESFLSKAEKLGASVDDEGKRNLGNILEGAKYLYHRAGIEPATKPAKKKAVKKKAAAKKKSVKNKATTKKSGK